MSYTITIKNNETNETTEINWSDTEVAALKNRIVGDEGIINYIQGALAGVVHKCTKNMRREWETTLKDKFTSLPTDDSEFVNLVIGQDDYKDAKIRKEEKESIE